MVILVLFELTDVEVNFGGLLVKYSVFDDWEVAAKLPTRSLNLEALKGAMLICSDPSEVPFTVISK